MKRNLYREYMDSKGKVRKARVDPLGGDPDPKTPPNKPPKGGKAYKHSDGKPKKANPKGFGEMGENELKFQYDLKGKGKAPAKIPTCEQVELTTLVAEGCSQDPTLIENLVRSIKSEGLLGALVAELLEHRESFKHVAEMMAHRNYGPNVCTRLIRAMNEEVAPNFSSQLEDEDMEDDEDEEGEDMDMDGEDMDMDDESGGMGGMEDENGELDVGMEDGSGDMDPSMMGGDPSMGGDMSGMDPSMMGGDPSMGGDMSGMDPSMGGMDPSMMGMGGMNQDPSMGGAMPPMGPMGGMQAPQNPMMGMGGGMPPAMANFQREMMRRYQRNMMRKR